MISMLMTGDAYPAYNIKGYRMTTRTRKQPATQPATFTFQYVSNNVVKTDVMEYTPLAIDTLASHSKSGASINASITSALMLGKALQFNSGADYVKFLNEDKNNYIPVYKKDANGITVTHEGVPVIDSYRKVTKDDVKSTYDLLDVAKSAFKLSGGENLVSRWNDYTSKLIVERNAINAENVIRKANGESLKTNIKVPAPTPNGILKMLKPVTEVNHLEAAVKSMKTAYNHFLELKGKQAQLDSEKLAALIVTNGGEI
jgi:hypothetical protein